MLIRCLLIAIVVVATWSGAARTGSAQNGQLIEGLFRTLAESQLERERQKRAEAEERARREAIQREQESRRDPYEVRLPSGFGVPQPNLPARPPVGTPPGAPIRPDRGPELGSINVRSEKAAQYAQNLVAFNQSYSQLVAELRSAATRNAELRTLMPQVYEVSASGRTLLRQCDGLSVLSPIIPSHQEWDSRWRNISFQLRRVGGLSDSCNDAIRTCDQLCTAMSRQLNIQPQFDRIALRDQMTTAAAHMQTLMDDLELSSIPRDQCHRLEHDCRLLRQQLLADAQRIDRYGYNECVSKFSDFASRWRAFGAQAYALGDAHIARRLDRISECGEATYELLWIPPPSSVTEIGPIATRLKQKLDLVTEKMTLRALTSLPPGDQVRVLESVRQLTQQSVRFTNLATSSRPQRAELQSAFRSLDETWCAGQPLFVRIPTVNLGHVAEINRSCEQLREALNLRADYASPVRLADLVHSAAALEGTAEVLRDHVLRNQRYFQPNEFRAGITENVQSFYRHAKEVHELLSRGDRMNDRRHMAELQEETGHLLEDWNQLAPQLSQIQNHGLSGPRATQIQQTGQEAVPPIAQLAAALLDQS
ncbi:hypothetical protein [Stieleria varia]|uniref:Secreted protein n=1 Tax=Stieleria varia TaxID=2528005 RepID=A0A5C6AYE0_9BACT|nr:hypothetical protein [Stieleria varia]TWU05065.1 hypothetical protein Pla52n_31110 [Stieleria varia]